MKEPTIGQIKLNLFQLYVAVWEYGGFRKVCEDRYWRKLGDKFGVPETCTNAAYILKQQYSKYILDLFLDEAKPKATVGSSPKNRNESRNLNLNINEIVPQSGPTSPVEMKLRIRLLRSLQCQLPNEIEWALEELLRISCGWNIFYFSYIPELSASVLDLLVKYLDEFPSSCTFDWKMSITVNCSLDIESIPSEFSSNNTSNLKRIIVFLWNTCISNIENCQFLLKFNMIALSKAISKGLSRIQLFYNLHIQKNWFDFVSYVCKEHKFVLDIQSCSIFENFLNQSLISSDRYLRLVGLEIMGNLFSNRLNALWSWEVFELSLGSLVFFNAVIPDEQIQALVVEYLFTMGDAFEAFNLESCPLKVKADSFCLIVDILFHVIFDNHSFTKHLKNIQYKNIFKGQNTNAGQILSKWLMLCYVHCSSSESTLDARDIYSQFEMFCAREGFLSAPLDWSVFLNKTKEVYPKSIIETPLLKNSIFRSDSTLGNSMPAFDPYSENASLLNESTSGSFRFALKPRDWNERPVKTTEKIINATLALRNFALLPLQSELIEQAFNPHFDSICQLASVSDSKNTFISKHFGFILCELFCREK